MKYEISDLLNDKNKYALTILRMHLKANKNVLPFLIITIMIYDNIIIHALFIIISSMGLLILTSDLIPDYIKFNKIFYYNYKIFVIKILYYKLLYQLPLIE